MTEMEERVEDAWTQSLCDVLREVIRNLPDHATLGELVDATRASSHLAPVLEVFSVQELIDVAKARPRAPAQAAAKPAAKAPRDPDGEMGPDSFEIGPSVIRRRADVPDADLRVLTALASSKTGRKEAELSPLTELASDQLRLVLRHLRSKNYVHVEGSGVKRRLKITRTGAIFLRKSGDAA